MVYKFIAVSLINTAVDLAVLNLLFLLARGSESVPLFILFKGVAFTAAVTNSYFLNRRFTFRVKATGGGEEALRFGKFYLVNLVSLALNVTVAAIAFSLLGPKLEPHWLATNASALLGSLSGLGINYTGYQRVFRKRS
jgi:putative flippase GtrA